MFKTIVWATDGSETADRALPYATALASAEGARIVALHCKEIFVGGRAGGYPLFADEDQLEEKVRGQVNAAEAAGLTASLEVVTDAAGHVAHAIADAAAREHADVIVIGTRGHAPVAGLLVGSVTQRLLHVAPCPVLAVPPNLVTTSDRAEREGTLVA